MKFDYSKLRPQTTKLSNGTSVYLFPDKNLDLVRLEFIFDAGEYFQQKKLQASACCKLIGAGTENFSADALSEELDYFGSYMERYWDRDQSCIIFYSLSRHFADILPFCEEALKRSVFPQRELDTHLRNARTNFLVSKQKVATLARLEFYPMVFGAQHPYGNMATEEDFSHLTREDVLSFYRRFYCARNATIVLAGNYNEKDLQLLDKFFGAPDRNGEKPDVLRQAVAPMPCEESLRSVPMKNSLQQAVITGMPLFSFSHPHFSDFKVVDFVLGGYFGSRLMRNIREDKGYTYGIYTNTVPLRHSPVWKITSEVKQGCAQKVLKEIHKEIHRLQSECIPQKELDLVRNCYMGEIMQDLDGTFDIAERMKFYLSSGTGPEYYERMEQTLFSITPHDIKRYAQEFLQPEKFKTVIAG